MRAAKRYLLLAALLASGSSAHGFWESILGSDALKGLTGGGKPVEFAFLTDTLEARKKELQELQTSLESYKRESEEGMRSISRTLAMLNNKLAEEKELLREAVEGDAEFHSAMIAILNDRIQTITAMQATWKDAEAILESHIVHMKDLINNARDDKEGDQKTLYKLQDLKESERRITENADQLYSWTAKRDTLIKQKSAESEKLAALKKELDYKAKEKDKLDVTLFGEMDREEAISASGVSSRAKSEILEQQMLFIREKIEATILRINKKIAFDFAYADEEVSRLKNKESKLKADLENIKKKLLIDTSDIELAKSECREASRKAAANKDLLSKEKEQKRIERDKVAQMLEGINEQLKRFKGQENDKSAEYYAIEAQSNALQYKLAAYEKELTVYEYKREVEDFEVQRKEIYARMIHVRHKMRLEKGDINEYLAGFRNLRNLAYNSDKIMTNKQTEALAGLQQISFTNEVLKKRIDEVKSLKETIFKMKPKVYQDTLGHLEEAERALQAQLAFTNNHVAIITDIIHRNDHLISQSEQMVRELETHKNVIDVWKRSSRAISIEGMYHALIDAERFLDQLFWDTPGYLTPSGMLSNVNALGLNHLLSFSIFILLFMMLFLVLKIGLRVGQRKLKYYISIQHSRLGFLYLNVLDCCVDFVRDNFLLIFSWSYLFAYLMIKPHFFLHTHVLLNHPYFVAMFYMVTIPIFLYLSHQLLSDLKALNQKLSFFFFNEQAQAKFITLAAFLVYSGSVLLPFRLAFMKYMPSNSELPAVLLAAYSLILVVVLLMFFNKEDVLKLIPLSNYFFIWLKRKIDAFYHPVFLFLMSLLVLSNPYVGYSHLAWFLVFAVPASLLVVAGLFLVHHYLRKYSVFLFLKEDDEDITDKFDHAKMYYAFFIIASFVGCSLIVFYFIARIWGVPYTLDMLWKSLSDEWVIPLFGAGKKFGFIELCIFVSYVMSAFLISTFVHKFILNKLFDIFRTEPGAQNTIARILHYLIIFFMILLGFAAIRQEELIRWAIPSLLLGIAFGLQSQIADFLAGLLVLLERQIEIGHFIGTGIINADGTEVIGTVDKIAVRSTTVRTARNFSVIIPNHVLISKPIINWGRGRYSVGLELSLWVNFNSDPELTKQVLHEVIAAHAMILRVPSPVVRLEEFAELGQRYFVRAFISSRKVREQWEIASDLRIGIIKAFQKNNIVLSYPHRVIHVQNDAAPLSTKSAIDIKFDGR